MITMLMFLLVVLPTDGIPIHHPPTQPITDEGLMSLLFGNTIMIGTLGCEKLMKDLITSSPQKHNPAPHQNIKPRTCANTHAKIPLTNNTHKSKASTSRHVKYGHLAVSYLDYKRFIIRRNNSRRWGLEARLSRQLGVTGGSSYMI
jgi:hypothetical protein